MERTVTSLPMTLATVLEAPARMVDVSTAPRRSGLRHVLGHIQERYHCLHPLLYATLIQYKLIIGPFAYLHFPSSLWGSTGGRRQKAGLGAVQGGAEGWARPRRFQRKAEVPGAGGPHSTVFVLVGEQRTPPPAACSLNWRSEPKCEECPIARLTR